MRTEQTIGERQPAGSSASFDRVRLGLALRWCGLFLLVFSVRAETFINRDPQGTVRDVTLGTSSWTAQGSPYVLEGHVNIAKGALLTIESGVDIQISDRKGIYVYGDLAADGATFRSRGAGNWLGLYFSPDALGSSLKNSTIDSAGGDSLGYIYFAYRRAAVYLETSPVRVENCRIINSAGNGIELLNAAASVRNNSFENVAGYAVAYDHIVKFAEITGNHSLGNGIPGIYVPGGSMVGTNIWTNPGEGLSYVVGGELTLEAGGFWAIQPGVTIRTTSQRFLIWGNLQAIGTENSPILFTSGKPTPGPGDWKGLVFGAEAGSSIIEHAVIEYAGQDSIGYFHFAYRSCAIFVDDSDPHFEQLTISQSLWHGIELYASNARLKNSTIRQCGGNALIGQQASRPIVEGTLFDRNGAAQNGFYTVRIDSSSVPEPQQNSFSGNQFQGVQVTGGNLDRDGAWLPWAANAPYVLTGDMTVNAGVVWTVAPSTIVKVSSAGIYIQGTLSADAGQTEIQFTSLRDDSRGGNTDASDVLPEAGQWKGIYLSPNAGNSVLKKCSIAYAGQDSLGYLHFQYRQAAVYVDSCAPQLVSCSFLASAGHTLELYSSSATIRDCAFSTHGPGYYSLAYDTLETFPTLSGNSFAGAGPLGISIPGGTISGNQRWDALGGPAAYYLNGEVTLADGATLTIAAGTTILSEAQRLIVLGALRAEGTAERRITFGSRQATPKPGDWKGIYFGPNAGASQLDYVTISDAGHDSLVYAHFAYRRAAIFVDLCSPQFNQLRVERSGLHGIECYGSNAEFGDLTVQDCGGHALVARAESRPVVRRAAFTNNGSSDSGYWTVHMEPNSVIWPEQVAFVDNKFQGVQLPAGNLAANGVWKRWATNAPYVLTGDVTVNAGVRLIIEPGAALKLWRAGLYCDGTIVADGASEEITFTSLLDDSIAGDSNGDQTTPAPGQWRGVYLSPNAGRSILRNCTIRYAGMDNLGYFHFNYRQAALYFDSCSPVMEGCRIWDSGRHGLELYSSRAIISGNDFQNFAGGYAILYGTLDCFPEYNQNRASGAGTLGIAVPDGSIATTGRWQNPGEGFGYFINNSITIEPGVALTVDPGVQIRPKGGIYVLGTLDARGSAQRPIRFGSQAAEPKPGDWKGIYLGPGAGNSRLSFCELGYAGADALGYYHFSYWRTGLFVDECQPTLGPLSIVHTAGDGMICHGAGGELRDSVLWQNSAAGIDLRGNASTRFSNNTIVQNSGPGLRGSSSAATIANSIIAFNSQGIQLAGGTITLRNNDLFGNSQGNYQGVEPGATDLSLDPLFVNPAAGDFHLLPGSPAVDAGDNQFLDATGSDRDGKLRLHGVRVDLGAYELDAAPALHQVDTLIRAASDAVYIGGGVGNIEEQTRVLTVPYGTAAVFFAKWEYQGNVPDDLIIRAPASVSEWKIRYFAEWGAREELTSQIGGSGFLQTNVSPNQTFELRIEISAEKFTPGDSAFVVPFAVSSFHDPDQHDTVRAVAINATRFQPDLLIRRFDEIRYAGENIINLDGSGQNRELELESGQTGAIALQLINQGNLPDELVLHTEASAEGFEIKYFNALAGGSNITAQITGPGWQPGSILAGSALEFRAEVYFPSNSSASVPAQWRVAAQSLRDPAGQDRASIRAIPLADLASPQTGQYTLNSDFEKGTLIGVEDQTVRDQLQLTKESVTLPFIWVPNSNEGTVSKVDTRTGKELGRYRTGPTANGNPSRTTVDQQGNCWVANRRTGTAVKLGLSENGQFIDRNQNGAIETSRDANDDGVISQDEMLPWGADECVLIELVLLPGKEAPYLPGTYTGEYANDDLNPGPRGVAVDANNNVWIGTFETKKFYYVESGAGTILRTIDVSSVNHRSYGAVIDRHGILWSSGHDRAHVLRLNPADGSFTTIPLGHFAYGLALDQHDHLFASGWQDTKLSRINVVTAEKEWTVPGAYESRGLAVTDDGDVWSANSAPGTVVRFSNDGKIKATISVGAAPTGVAVDSAGKVWVVNFGDEFIKRIDPVTDRIDLEKRVVGGTHYGYSDMTGIVSRNATSKLGVWRVIHNSRYAATAWDKVSWNSLAPEGTALAVQVRSSADRVNWSGWEAAGNGLALQHIPIGKYLEIEATLKGAGEASPILYDLTVAPKEGGELRISHRWLNAGTVELSWPASAADCVLECSEKLGPDARWDAVPTAGSTQFRLEIKPVPPTQFYRLRR